MGIHYIEYIEAPILPKYSHSIDRKTKYWSKTKKKFITYGCKKCKVHFTSSPLIISKDYRGKTGDAYLIDGICNVIESKQEVRVMLTGKYLVSNIQCSLCKQLIGWRYIKSERKEQRYKEGKYILELQNVYKCH